MLRLYFSKKTQWGLFLAFAILSWVAVYSYLNNKEVVESAKWVAHTNAVLYSAERTRSIALDIELGQRGYTLTGNPRFLEVYDRAKEHINDHLKKLLELTKDNHNQQERIAFLEKQVKSLLLFSTTAIAVRQQNVDSAIQLNVSLQGKLALDIIRNTVAEIEEEENFLLKRRTVANEYQNKKFNYTYKALLAITAFLLFSIIYSLNVQLGARIASQNQLKKASEEIKDLYDNAPCGYHSINSNGRFVEINQTLLRWLGYEKHEVVGSLGFVDIIAPADRDTFYQNFEQFKQRGFVHNLEFSFLRKDGTDFPVILSSTAIINEEGAFVKSRSITFDNTEQKRAENKIMNLNHELEAFTYSVSHDLRAPLRSINGYAKILEEDYGNKVDEEGRRLIKVIINNAKRMGQLIDDLLDFSRLGRKDVAKAVVNMTMLVKNVIAELVEQSPDRKLNIEISPLESTQADSEMIRQVWFNLIGNAIKYTGKTPIANIEIGSEKRDHEICYYVKDNGAGFDMKYVDKLFGVFQRLHKVQEFEGTGVGLAIVKRIVMRHGGRVWAESKVNEGSTFYFTIPNDNGN